MTLIQLFTAIANAIRAKTGSSGTIKAEDFPAEINSIPSGGGYPPNWSEIGYENTPQDILDGFNIAKEIKDNWDNTTTSMLEMFRGRKDIFIFPMIDTSNVTNMNSVFYSSSINIVPVLETKNVTGLYNTFSYCNQLEPNSLNNIMQMCINATSYTRAKTLKNIGLSSTQAETCQTLSNYQAFLDAGWTTGY